jgi:protein-S-isoprenylcysteine O-methyltransferase Ste14
MRRGTAAAGSALFFALAPGVVAGLVPWWLTRWQPGAMPLELPRRIAGAILFAAGAVALVHAFARFALEGLGTPAPPAPPERLVVGGLYRHVRNPMYIAVLSAIAGQGLLLGRPVLLVYAAGVLVLFAAFVRFYEEPHLSRRFGAEYGAYRRAVPGWWPRLRPWRPGGPR